jgi:hypothetical protein
LSSGDAAGFGVLGITDRKLRELRDAGVLPSPSATKWNVVACVKAFSKHELDSVSVSDLDAATEAAKLEKTKHIAEFESLRVELMQGTMHRTEDFVDVISGM